MPSAVDMLTVPDQPVQPERISGFKAGKLQQMHHSEAEYEPLSSNQMFTDTSNLIPMSSAMKGARTFIASKYFVQALPVSEPEAPLVDSLDESTGEGWSKTIGHKIGVHHSPVDGVVKSVGANHIQIQSVDGQVHPIELHSYYPANRKTHVHDTPIVKPGDVVTKGQMLAHNNYVDNQGRLGMGKNLRVAFVPGPEGSTFEDAIAVSESGAKKLSTSHLYGFDQELKRGVESNKSKFISLFPNKYTNEQLDKFGPDGRPKEGAVLQPGDPVLLAYSPRRLRAEDAALGNLHKALRNSFTDMSQTWDKPTPGIVTDSNAGRRGLRVNIATHMPLREGDKVSARQGAKGVISRIIPDEQMFRDANGKPMDILINPAALIGRVNPAMIFDALLGKVAEKTGKPYVLPAFAKESFRDFTEGELKKHGVSDMEHLMDPVTGRNVPNVLTGTQFFQKLEHTAESKESGRGEGGVDLNLQPSKGGDEGAKRLGSLQLNALLSHGALNVLRDAKLYRGGANTEMWSRIRKGLPLPAPETPFIFKKFIGTLKGAGINVKRTGDGYNIMAMTDKDVDAMARHTISSPETIDLKTGEAVSGGLFDPAKFGGPNGSEFSKIELHEKIPNPLMEEPIRSVLGLTKDKYRSILAGQETLGGKTGPTAIESALKSANLDHLEQDARSAIRSGRKAIRNNAVKQLGFVDGLKKSGLTADDMMISKIPVVPPNHRPIAVINGVAAVADPNYLYRDLLHSNRALEQNKKELPDSELAEERLSVYDSVRAIQGLGDPIHPETREKGVKGFLKTIAGGGGPKTGIFMQRVISHPVNAVGRSVVKPDANLNMDQIALPEEMAWRMFSPFTMGRMVRDGMDPAEASRQIEKRTSMAGRYLEKEMEHRPVMYSRDPSLHRFNIMGAHARIQPGNAISASPLVVKPFNLDFDGDQMNVHVPVTDEAIKEIKEKMMPSQNLLGIKNKKVHYQPSQEFVLGLFNSSTPNKSKPVSIFQDRNEALEAYRKGAIDLDTPLEILNH